MNDRVIVIAIISLLTFALFSSFILSVPNSENLPNITIISTSTDKPIYRSKDTLHLSIELQSSQIVEDVTLSVIGLTDKFGQARLQQIQRVNLLQGATILMINYTLPVCSRCAGLPPGDYAINLSLEKDNMTLAEAVHHLSIE